MKQLKLPYINPIKSRKEHGGTISLGRKRRRRPLSIKTPLHLVLRSDFAYGGRSLMRHRPLIQKVIKKAERRFHIRVYERGIASNHIHLLVRGKNRVSLQNFFRVVAGHIAQEILNDFPILPSESPSKGGAPENKRAKREKENKFWQTRIYSRIVTWGREYSSVKNYVIQNTLEALDIIAYQPRKSSRRGGDSGNTS